jgi:hypothetical protein
MSTIGCYFSSVSSGLLVATACLLGSPAAAQTDPFERGTQLVSGFTGPSFDLSGESEGDDVEGEEGIELETEWVFGGSYHLYSLETGSGGSSTRNDLSLTGGVSFRF